MAARKRWTVMVWMAGDNNLEDFGVADLRELKATGSTEAVDVVAQLDRMSDRRARRYYLRKGTRIDADAVADLGATNTGDPAVAIDFFSWAMTTYPAEHYLAVLWNHGSGIDETDIYRGLAGPGRGNGRVVRTPPAAVPRGRVRAIANRRFRRALFSTTIDAALASRAIAYDDSSRDFLDNRELKRVLVEVTKRAGRPLDIVGFDACLMNMVEVACQLRGTAGHLVGSQEVEPGDGWPYDRVLKDLAAKPDMAPAVLAARIVKRYGESYTGDDVTLSALDLARLAPVMKAIDRLSTALIAAIRKPEQYAAISKALLAAQRYSVKDFIDVCDLCAELQQRVKVAAVRDAAAATATAVEAPDGLVASEMHKGRTVSRSHGTSIYFPRGDISVAYDKLDFAKQSRWDDFIAAFGAA